MYIEGKPDMMHWLTIHVHHRVQYSDTIETKQWFDNNWEACTSKITTVWSHWFIVLNVSELKQAKPRPLHLSYRGPCYGV